MKIAIEDLEYRRPVWDAMQELFRDVELSKNDLEFVARALSESPYSEEELERIMFEEVYPVLVGNLRCVAGEWKGFDLDALEQAILKRLNKKWVWPTAFIPGRFLMREKWREVKALVSAAS